MSNSQEVQGSGAQAGLEASVDQSQSTEATGNDIETDGKCATPSKKPEVSNKIDDNTPGLAPLWLSEEPEPGSYFVCFKPGYTLAQHFELVGPEIQNKLYRAKGNDSSYAITEMLDQELLIAIRRDLNVEYVAEGAVAYDDWDEDE